jgi:EpsI family protein
MSEPALVTINPAQGDPSFQANRFVVQNGEGKQLMVYWYQGRGRSVASEYWGKIYTVVDSIKRRRSDGAMVRLTVSIGNSEETANAAALDIASRVASALPDYVPN